MLGCMELCEGAGPGGRWELGWAASRGGGASVEEEEVMVAAAEEGGGGGGNCCRGSGLGGKAMAGVAKPAELWLSLEEEVWLSRAPGGFSLPGGAEALGSTLRGWRRGGGAQAWVEPEPEVAVMPV